MSLDLVCDIRQHPAHICQPVMGTPSKKPTEGTTGLCTWMGWEGLGLLGQKWDVSPGCSPQPSPLTRPAGVNCGARASSVFNLDLVDTAKGFAYFLKHVWTEALGRSKCRTDVFRERSWAGQWSAAIPASWKCPPEGHMRTAGPGLPRPQAQSAVSTDRETEAMLGWRNLAWNQGPEGYSSHGDTHTCLSVPKVVSWKKGTSAGRL